MPESLLKLLEFLVSWIADPLRDISGIQRRGERVLAYGLFTIDVSLLIAGIILFGKNRSLGFGLIVGAVVVHTFLGIFVKGKVEEKIIPRPKFDMLYGPNPISAAHGACVKRWGRAGDIRQLRDWIKGEEAAAIIVWGEPAVGKTSLVNAGLREELRTVDLQFVSVDARENFHAKLASLFDEKEDGTGPKSRKKKVVVIDNASTLHGSRLDDLLGFVRKSAEKYDSKKVLVIIVDREDFLRIWRDYDWTIGADSYRIKDYFVEKFTVEQAKHILTIMKKDASISVDDEILIQGVNDLAEPDEASGTRLVEPQALSTLAFVLAREAGAHEDFGMEDYSGCGQALGLLGSYLEGKVRPLAPTFGRQILMGLGKVGESDGPFAPDMLGLTNQAMQEMKAVFRSLSSSELRVLRSDPEAGKYRIGNAWMKVLRSMVPTSAPTSDDPKVAKEERINQRYREWRQWSTEKRYQGTKRLLRRYGAIKYLLTWSELRSLRKLGLRMDRGVKKFLSRSLEYRVVFLALSLVLVGSMAIWGVLYYQRSQLRRWGIPAGISENQNLKTMTLGAGCWVQNLSWLPKNLKRLELVCPSVKNLDGIPNGLTYLDLNKTGMNDFRSLPESVTGLGVPSSVELANIVTPSSHFTHLNLAGLKVSDMRHLPRSLESLILNHVGINSLNGLPSSVKTLDLRGTMVGSLADLPSGLRKLILRQNAFEGIDYLPPHLDFLDTDRVMSGNLKFPDSLRTLHVRGRFLPKVPEQITTLELSGGTFWGSALPPDLERLWVNSTQPSADLGELPPGLKDLKFVWPHGAKFEDLPKNLKVLDLSFSWEVTSLSGLKAPIESINLTNTGVRNFRELPHSITSLTDQYCEMIEVKELPEQLKVLNLSGCSKLELLENVPSSIEELDLSFTAVSSLPNISKLEKLVKLNIRNSKIAVLSEWPPNLQELTVNFHQLDHVKGMPSSVKTLNLIGRPGEEVNSGEGGRE